MLAVLRGTEKLEVLARRHLVSANTLRRWRDEFRAGGRDRLTGNGDAVAARTDERHAARSAEKADPSAVGYRGARAARTDPARSPDDPARRACGFARSCVGAWRAREDDVRCGKS